MNIFKISRKQTLALYLQKYGLKRMFKRDGKHYYKNNKRMADEIYEYEKSHHIFGSGLFFESTNVFYF